MRNFRRRNSFSTGKPRRTEITPYAHSRPPSSVSHSSVARNSLANGVQPASGCGSAAAGERTRLLAEYERELLNMDRALETELETVREAERQGTAFEVRHSVKQFAQFILRLDRELRRAP